VRGGCGVRPAPAPIVVQQTNDRGSRARVGEIIVVTLLMTPEMPPLSAVKTPDDGQGDDAQNDGVLAGADLHPTKR